MEEGTIMPRVMACFNICQLGNQSNTTHYIDCIKSLLFQNAYGGPGADYKVVISGCAITRPTQDALRSVFQDAITCNYIDGNYPLSVTFNHTIDKCVEAFGPFEAYLYIDSGISFWDPQPKKECPHCQKEVPGYSAVKALFDIHNAGPNAITAAFPSNDDGSQWWGIAYKPDEDFIMPVGKATNMHCQFFSEEWRQAYKRILPDIFASNCMESVFACMAAAIHRRYVVTHQVHLQHAHSIDGASIGSRQPDPDRYPMSKMFKTAGLLYKTKKDMDARFREGKALGFGFEECAEYWRHDPTKFERGCAKDPLLKEFLAREMFLKPEEFDYSSIKSIFLKGR